MTILDQTPGDVLVGDVDTPELASWGSRVVAALLDSAILTGTAYLVDGRLQGVSWWLSFSQDDTVPVGRTVVVTLALLLLLQAFTGATPGKRLVGIQVVHEGTGRPVGVLRTLGRQVAHVLDAICYIGYLRPLWNERRRTLADSAAATDVVRGRPGPRVRGIDVWTAASAVVCAAGVGFSVGGTTGSDAGGSFACTGTQAEEAGVELVDLRWWTSGSTPRLGVTRDAQPADDLSVTWTFAQDVVPPDGTVLSTTVASDDGAFRVTRTGTVQNGALVGEVGVSNLADDWSIRVPADAVAGVGPHWRWTASLTPPGTTTEVCPVERTSSTRTGG
ncbi:RDD family protein [Cellulomonas sp.]|uniref:RDD family protein n=1 Tax=Cellulomonas sp. TaxID=40001 RepID=UPI001B2788CF|nr:RDD family protein [Cellulomonas sp.]MBO9554586.1 RDD family protein [Cellulomonas sp.]